MRLPWTTLACFASCRHHRQLNHYQTAPLPASAQDDTTDNGDAAGETMDSLSIKLMKALNNDEAQAAVPSSPYPHQRAMKVLGSRLSNLSLNRTYVGPSPIAGRGLFAADHYPAGTLLTCYPGDGIVEDNEEITWGDHVDMDHDDDDCDSEEAWDTDYLMYMTDEIGLVGLPHLHQDPAYLGHFGNDGVAEIPKTVQDVVTNYLEESKQRANAMEQEVLNCHMVLVATRDIVKNEEIFLSYGPEYWMQQPGFVA